MRASGVQLAVAIAMAVDVAMATFTWLDTSDVMFEHVIYILPPATVTVIFVSILMPCLMYLHNRCLKMISEDFSVILMQTIQNQTQLFGFI